MLAMQAFRLMLALRLAAKNICVDSDFRAGGGNPSDHPPWVVLCVGLAFGNLRRQAMLHAFPVLVVSKLCLRFPPCGPRSRARFLALVRRNFTAHIIPFAGWRLGPAACVGPVGGPAPHAQSCGRGVWRNGASLCGLAAACASESWQAARCPHSASCEAVLVGCMLFAIWSLWVKQRATGHTLQSYSVARRDSPPMRSFAWVVVSTQRLSLSQPTISYTSDLHVVSLPDLVVAWAVASTPMPG